MSGDNSRSENCQVDFYLNGQAVPASSHIACDLALMVAERNQKIFVLTVSSAKAEQISQLMWQYPQGRFLPHAVAGEPDADKAPVIIGVVSDLYPTDVVINLSPEAVPNPQRFKRILEIVPYADDEKESSRIKYKTYRTLGLTPHTQETNK